MAMVRGRERTDRRADGADSASASGTGMTVSAMFPCYNDAATIGGLVDDVHAALTPLVDELEVIVVNDGSSDGSREVLDELSVTRPWLRVIHHEANRGYGGALISGFEAARHDWIFYTDGDAQYDAKEAAQLVPLATDDVDIVQGYKLGRGDPLHRKVIGRVYHHGVKRLFSLVGRDTDCDFRLFRRRLIQDRPLVSTSGVICVEMMRSFRDQGARFVEAPVHHFARPSGSSQFFRVPAVARSAAQLLVLWWRMVGRSAQGARWAFRLALVGAALTYYFVGRHQWFTRDDWASLISRPLLRETQGVGAFLFTPQDGHWMTVPEIVYDVTDRIFQLDSYWPYLLPAMLAHVGTVLLIRVLCLRHGVSPWATTLACTTLLVFGAGWQNIVFAIQITFNFSLIAFVAQLVLIDHDGPVDRRDYIGSALVLLGVMSSGFGPIFMVGIFVLLVLRRRWKALLVALVPQVAIYAWWYFTWLIEENSAIPIGNRSQLPAFIELGIRSTFDALVGFEGLGVVALVGTLAVILTMRFGWRTQSMLLALAATAVAMFAIVGFERLGLGLHFADESRYLYIAGILLTPAFALMIDQLGRVSRELRWAGLGVVATAAAVNLSLLVETTNRWSAAAAYERHTFQLVAGSGLIDDTNRNRPLFVESPDVTPGVLADLVARGAFVPIVPVTAEEIKRVRDALGLPPAAP